MWEEKIDFGDSQTAAMKALGRPINLPWKRKAGVGVGGKEKWEALKG